MQPFKQQYLFLSAQSYRMTDENTGEIREGISLSYVPDNNLSPYEDPEPASRGQVARGKKVAKLSLPIGKLEKLNAFPGLYDVTLEFSVVANKQQVRPKDIDFVSAVELVQSEKTK